MRATTHHAWAKDGLAVIAAALLLSPAPTAAQDSTIIADTAIPEIVVTSQRTEQAIERVPIAITAFDNSALENFQIENFGDLQFFTPNVTFAKVNFTSSNFQIRGIGNALVAASSDQGVGVHVNDVPLVSPRLFETEYFDVERIEVLRGPQGTLYGRNSTGGAVNMITKRPTDEFEIFGEFEYGNYDAVRGETAINIPINDVVAIRLAALYVNRDGYTQNLFTGNDIDGRDSYALRGSVRLQPGDTMDINLMVSYFKEDSTRTRSQKQMCNPDPTGLLGCLPDMLAFGSTNLNSTLGGILSSSAILGPLGLFPFDPASNASGTTPADFRTVELEFDPVYKSDELLITLEVEQEIGDDLTVVFVGGYQDTKVFSQTDYNADLGPPVSPSAFLPFVLPITHATFFADGRVPTSAIDPGNSGLIGGHIFERSDRITTYDQSDVEAEQFSAELRLQSHYDGAFNFMVGGLYLNFDSSFNYYVVSNTLDYFAVVGGGAIVADGLALGAPYFNSDTDRYELESYAMFGELYYDITDDLKLTGGIRYTDDTKTIRDRQNLYDTVVPLGTDPIPDAILNAFRDGFAGDASGKVSFDEITGRVVLEWTPELAGTDSSLFYASYSRGYKGGGINPPFDPALFPDTSEFFEPEFIDAYEIGTKQRLAGNTVSVNLTGFYYDYAGLQVSKIQNRTSFNENIDAKIWGVENEVFWAPDQHWLFNVNASYLNSSIGDSFSVDPRDPTNGSTDVTLIKDLGNASNCVINHNGAPGPLTTGVIASQFSSCDALAAAFADPAFPLPYTVSDGVEANLKGNELQQSPDFTINIGVQYAWIFGNGMTVTSRVDYYFQTSMWGRIFNRDPIDKIGSFDIWNAQITLESADESWYLRLFIQNIENDDDVVSMYLTDASSGLWTNVFTTEPRRYGFILGARF